ncbi:MAG: hypothetical protein DA330_04130 [Nitrososphaera sp.]|nr:hypothetical protein [Nitrososphaera sp.]
MSDPNSPQLRDRSLEFRFPGRAQEEIPRVALYSREGKTVKKIKSFGDKADLLEISKLMKEGIKYGFGPDIDERDVTTRMLVSFRPSKLTEWSNTGVIELSAKWRDWLRLFTCVRGDVHRCTPRLWWLDVAARRPTISPSLATAISRPTAVATVIPSIISRVLQPDFELPVKCAPICNAVVEVYEKTCCCRLWPPYIDIIDRLRDIIDGWPPIPDPIGPIELPDPIPIPMPGPDPAPFRESLRNVRLLRASGAKIPLGNPPEKLGEDYYALSSMPAEQRLAYLDDRYYLYPIFCSCSTRKVGETAVDEDGEFSFCYRRNLTTSGCRVTYFYKVRQWQGNQWVYIYDGSTTHEYFRESDDAHLRTWKGRACEPGDDIPDIGTEFVMLENIGVIPSWKLASPVQDSEFGVNTPAPTDGLVSHNYTGQPWAQSLSFRLKFTEGLKALGAKYYRVSVAEANGNGDAVGTPLVLTNPIAWSRWKWVGMQLQTESVSLGPNTVGSNAGLYTIPYESDAPDGGWLWFQFHQWWNTLVDPVSIVNGKYLVTVEVFDASGNRLKPNGSVGLGTDKPFTFRRWTTETITDAVNFAALTHLFHVNNVSCYGDIVDLRKNSVPSIEECQFIQGCTNDNFSVGFYAFHVNRFMASYSLWYHRGLNGPNVTIETGTTNAPAGVPPIPSPLNSANAKQSNSKTFSEMLETHQKCSFAIELRVYPKHTNGMGIIHGYGASDTAAFALEKVLCLEAPLISRPEVIAVNPGLISRPNVPN